MPSWCKNAFNTITNATGIAAGTYYLMTHKTLPPKSGTIHQQGLHKPVKIITDNYGIPHIYAHNEDDLFFGQGYIHAQERLWQMEVNRRLGSGRLSEIFGEATLETDRFCRRLRLNHAAQAAAAHLSPHNQRLLTAYANGVNAFIENSHQLPVEFVLLNITPEPWLITDSLQLGKIQGWTLSGNWETELIRAQLVAKVGADKASLLEAGYDTQHPLIIPPGASYQGINLGLLEHYKQIQEISGFGQLNGSNNWVVDGTLTASGSPLLCNDPHLGQTAPSVYFECHLIAGDLNVCGVSLPGGPGIAIGHNQAIAWGITNAISDVEDLYMEKFHPTNSYLYEFQGQWEEAQVLHEEIHIKGQTKPAIEEVIVTRHGPIITSLPHNDGPKELPLALRWTGHEHHRLIDAVYHLNRATNWEEFCSALRSWDVPAQNFVYADCAGNIGYLMAGAIPIRAHGQALLPSPGWTGTYEWTGLIPFEELPQTFNPEQHFIITANNRVVDDTYPYYISHEWLNGYRAQRIHDLLTNRTMLTVADMATMQADQYSLPATEILPTILTLIPKTPLQQAALEILQAWDYILSPQSIAATIYTTFLHKLTTISFCPILGNNTSLTHQYMGVGSTNFAAINGCSSRSTPLLIRLLKERNDNWFKNSAIPNGPHTWDTALERAFEATLEQLQEQLGNNILRWQYSTLHKMQCSHLLGSIKSFAKFFNRGPFPVGGDSDTINIGASSYSKPEHVLSVPTYRQIIDLGNFDNSKAIHIPGQSGHPASKHYDDLLPLWREQKYHPVHFHLDHITAAAEGTLQLLPKE